MRVLQLIDSLVAGGKERQFVELLKGLKSEPGIDCAAVVMSDVIEYPEFHELAIATTVLQRRSRWDMSLFPRLYRVMRGFRPDIVQSWNSMSSVYGAPLTRLVGAKFVDGSVRNAVPDLSLWNRDYFRLKLCLPLADAVVGNSLAGLATFRVPGAKAVCIRNGFDRARLNGLAPEGDVRRSLGIATPFVVGMVGSFSPSKDYRTFFGAARRVLELRTDVSFVAVGSGEQLPAFRNEFSGEARMMFVGRRDDVESVVNSFTIGVLTSTRGEGISNAIMEYMALGKPVLATDCGGNRELVDDGRSGWLIGGGDEAALAERILHLLDNSGLAHAFGEQGRRRIEERFSVERLTQDHLRLYRDLMARR